MVTILCLIYSGGLTATSSPPKYIKHNIVTILKYPLQSVQPDDGHLRAETCSCKQHPTYAI